MRSLRRPGRPLAAPILAPLVALLLLGAGTAASWDLHHHSGPVPAVAEGTVYCPGAAHPDAPPHVEATEVLVAPFCPVCLLRAQTEGLEVEPPVPGLRVAREVGRVAVPAPAHLADRPLLSASPRGPPLSRA